MFFAQVWGETCDCSVSNRSKGRTENIVVVTSRSRVFFDAPCDLTEERVL
jgi:hypothetical protein